MHQMTNPKRKELDLQESSFPTSTPSKNQAKTAARQDNNNHMNAKPHSKINTSPCEVHIEEGWRVAPMLLGTRVKCTLIVEFI